VLAASTAGRDCDAWRDTWRQRAAPIPGAARERSQHKSVALDHIERKAEAARGTDRKRRRESSLNAPSPNRRLLDMGLRS
jgi:hypothetical protein